MVVAAAVAAIVGVVVAVLGEQCLRLAVGECRRQSGGTGKIGELCKCIHSLLNRLDQHIKKVHFNIY